MTTAFAPTSRLRRSRSDSHAEAPNSVLGKASILLSAFGPDHPELSLADLVRRTGLPKSTAHRLAGVLVKEGWLEFEDNTYRVGLRLFALGSLARPGQALREAALPFMQDLFEATHEIVHLGVLRGTEVLYIDKIGGHRSMDVPSRVGGSMPAHATGLGKAMLAVSPPAVVRQLSKAHLAGLTPYTIVNPALLSAELHTIARRGYAIDREESRLGMTCAAAPIVCRGEVVGAVSVTGPTFRLDPERLAPAVRTAALGVGRTLAGRTR